MSRFESATLKFTSNRTIPLAVRRKVAKWLIPRDGREFAVSIDGVNYQGKLDNYIEWLVYVTRSFFEYTYLNVIGSLVDGGVALDVGANVGNHTLAFSRMFDRVLSFEPLPFLADRLQQRAATLSNVTVHRVALSNTTGTMKFAPPTTSNWGQGKIDDAGTQQVPVVPGDELVREGVTERVNFIKIDVEGHELEVLSGLGNTIAKDRPVVMFEIPRELRKDKTRSLGEAFDLFPENYRFAAFRNQSTFPVQTEYARVTSIDRRQPKVFGRITYALAYGEERGFEVRGHRIRRTAKG